MHLHTGLDISWPQNKLTKTIFFSLCLNTLLSYLTVILRCHQSVRFTLTTLAHTAGAGSDVEVKGHLRVRLTQSSSVSFDRKLAR